jgi:DNA-binding NarL/FixJ family response regulator
VDTLPGASQQTILIVEDHDAVRAGLYDWLSAVFAGRRIVEARNGEEALALAAAQPLEVVLIDIVLPMMTGIEATRRIKALAPQTEVLILSMHDDHCYQDEATAAGASAYVCKVNLSRDLLPALRRLLGRLAPAEATAQQR